MNKQTVFTVRLNWQQARKLSRLAAQTGRSRGAVVRLLIDQVRLANEPDLVLDVVEQ